MKTARPAAALRAAMTFIMALALSLSFGLTLVPAPVAHAATDPCSYASTNPIPCENAQPGTDPSISGVMGGDSSSIMGFTTDISVNQGGTVSFKISSAKSYTIAIYRIGYYQGLGARLIASVTPTSVTSQPSCLSVAATGLIDCGNWSVSATWTVPSTAVSGIYYALLTDSANNQSHIPFIVRSDASQADIAFKTNDTTWAAYNDYGGNSLYYGNAPTGCGATNQYTCGRAYKVSYNRPFNLQNEGSGYGTSNYLWYAEYPMVRWLEANGYNVSYISSVDVERAPSLLRNHKVILSAGHDEYWSGGERTALQSAAAAGVNIVSLTGNTGFWKTRWENSIDGTNTAYRTMVSYKETLDNKVEDPLDPPTWTGTWRDPRFSPPADGGRPENALLGTLFAVNRGSAAPVISAAFAKLRLWRGTAVAALTGSQTATLGSQTIGYEWDADWDNGFRPAGLFDAAATLITAPEVIQDYGNTYSQANVIWAPTIYRVAGGGLIFSTGSVQWAWGLDTDHATVPDSGPSAPDVTMEQATINILADMQAQPATIQTGLVAASASSDTVAPTSSITSPAAGATANVGTPVTISGTATDSGGGVVAGIEVSTDGGSTWHKASLTAATTPATWSYSWTPSYTGTATIESRAVDDSANLEAPTSSVSVTVNPRLCPCSLFPNATPGTVNSADATAAELGVKFTADSPGTISGIKFYKGSSNTGTHIGNLWTASGTLLATGTFTNETASGWQTLTFSSPVSIQGNTQYVASYHTNAGNYSSDAGYFNTQYDLPPLHALASGASGGNGVYIYSASSAFPTQTFNATNYYVDVIYNGSSTATPQVISASPAPNSTGAASTTTVTAKFNENVTASSIQFTLSGPGGTAVAGTTSYDASTFTATFTPSAALAGGATYSATVAGATDTNGHTMTSPYTWSFTTQINATTPPAVTSTSPASNATGVALSATPSATFNESVNGTSIQFTLTGPNNQAVSGTFTYNSSVNTVTFTPSAALATGTTYTATVSGATSSAGIAMTAPYSWSFTTLTCPCSVFAANAVPANVTASDGSSVEVGMKFTSDINGYIDGVRFYKGPSNTGTHLGNLWSATGTLLAQVTFTNETASGWQQGIFSTPVAITAGTTYVVSYHTVAGYYSYTSGGFTSGVDNGDLHAPSSSAAGGNGVYAYGATQFPTSTYNATNYWVDVVFTRTQVNLLPPAVTVTAPASGATNVTWGSTVSATFNEAVNSSSIQFTLTGPNSQAVTGTTSYNSSTNTATFTPSAALAPSTTYTATVSGATTSSGIAMTGPYSWSFTTKATCPCTLFAASAVPGTILASDTHSVELGMKFTADVSGHVTGVRFYKGTTNTGTHTGSLWTATGTLLAQVTFTNETASGWQQATFATPVAITAGTVYVVSYHTNVGNYSADSGFFNTAVDNAPLHGVANGTSPNGVYAYGNGQFPTKSFNATNYWVDLVFTLN
jgi:methionine-rich copper-binding protein CopC